MTVSDKFVRLVKKSDAVACEAVLTLLKTAREGGNFLEALNASNAVFIAAGREPLLVEDILPKMNKECRSGMNELQIFNYHDSVVRTIERDGELWWVLKDVCDVLDIKNSRDTAKRLDSDDVGLTDIIDGKGRYQQTYIINEPSLYNVIMRSDKPEAKDFKRWVTHEVLPAIRRTGAYAAPAITPAQLLAAQAQVLVDMERRMNDMQDQALALETKVDNALKAFSCPSQDHWKADMDAAIKTLCLDQRLSSTATRGRMYAELEQTAGCNINARLNRLRERMKKAGMRYHDAKDLTKLDAIAADKKLRAIFEGVVRSWQARAVSSPETLEKVSQ